jgi:hypothetical protein
MPLGSANNDVSAYLKKVEQELQELQVAVANGQASEMELNAKKSEYEALRQRQESQERAQQQQILEQGMRVGMNQVTGGSNTGFDMFGGGNQAGGLAAMSAAGGAVSGLMAGQRNYQTDPNMQNKKDGFGTKYMDARAHVGGTILGGAMGYFGGPAGAALAGPTVMGVHQIAEPTTRALINFGDSWGGAGGALMMDPIGTMSSGKYSVGQLAKGMLLGPLGKFIK